MATEGQQHGAVDSGRIDGDRPQQSGESLRTLLTIPNQFTIARLVISIVFFGLLVLVNHEIWPERRSLWLNLSLMLFVLAGVTDFLDGYLARRWNMLSSFGRVADPIVDKVIVCGAFVLLTRVCELVAPWIPVVLLTREFVISGLRSYLESIGIAFGAGAGGKLKMVIQSVTIPVVLFYEANIAEATSTIVNDVFRWTILLLLGLTIFQTLASSVSYIFQARRFLSQRSSRR